MKKVLFLLIILIAVMGVFSAEGQVIPGLVKPTGLQIEGTTLYIVEDTTVHIFDKNTLKKTGQFGKSGEGPREFMTMTGAGLPLILTVQENELVVASLGKISRWSLQGQYISEFSYNMTSGINPLLLKNHKFIAQSMDQDEQKNLYQTVLLCDEKMNKIKEIYRALHVFQGLGKGLKVLAEKPFLYHAKDDCVYLPGKEGNQVDIYTLDMTLKHTVSVPKDKRPLDQAFKDRILEEINANPQIKTNPEAFKPIIFPDTYPSISFFFSEGKRLFVFSWNWGKDFLEYYSFNTENGTELGKNKIPVQFQSAIQPYPFTVKNDTFYQLIENEDEEWELISSPLK